MARGADAPLGGSPTGAAPSPAVAEFSAFRRGVLILLSRAPWLLNVALAAAFLAVWWAGLGVGLALRWQPIGLSNYAIVGFLAAAAIAVCRTFPLPGLLGIAIATAWPEWWFEVSALRVLPLVVGGYLAASAGLRLLVTLPIVLAGTFFALVPILSYFSAGIPDIVFVIESLRFMDPSGRILASIVVLAAALLGRSAFVQRRAVAELKERNEELVRLREADVARIATEERTAIAREIHDVVAHHVSAMVIRAQAADRVATQKPAELRETVRWIARSGQDALTAMRQVVKVLRSDEVSPIDLTATTFAASLEQIVSRVRDTGLRVDVSIQDDFVPTTIHEVAILRIVQEALTNVMLHSNAKRVAVNLISRSETVQLSIEDDGTAAAVRGRADHHGGSGLRGMRERAESAGGTLHAARAENGGWIVEAVLPLGTRLAIPE